MAIQPCVTASFSALSPIVTTTDFQMCARVCAGGKSPQLRQPRLSSEVNLIIKPVDRFVVYEELAFWNELGWTSKYQSYRVEWRRIRVQLSVWGQRQGRLDKASQPTSDDTKKSREIQKRLKGSTSTA